MAVVIGEACTKCGACIDHCPVGALSQEKNNSPVVVGDDCTDCGICVDTCPMEAITSD